MYCYSNSQNPVAEDTWVYKTIFFGKLINNGLPGILFAFLLFTAFKVTAQSGCNSNYKFEGTINDESSAYTLILAGTDSFSTGNDGQAFNLTGESYLDVPPELGQTIVTDASFYVSVDFMMPDEGIDESARVLFGNKDWAYDAPGFTFQLYNEKTEWQPAGIAYINFNIGGGTKEIGGRFYGVEMGKWYRAYFIVDFTTETVTFGLNERSYSQSLRETADGQEFDPEQFYESLSTKSIRIGAPQSYPPRPIEWHQFENSTTDTIAELLVDNLRITSPRPTGSPKIINDILTQLTNHVNGTIPLEESETEVLYTRLQTYLFGISFPDIEPEARAFINAHNTNLPPLYNPLVDETMKNHDDFPAYSKAYVALGLWMMREGLTTENASLAEGIVFQEHAGFPGAVPDTAQRVTGGTAAINATYVKDPYYNMGDMQTNETNELASYLYRPTGYWAPAGEVVTITVPSNAVNSGLHIRVGGHKVDHTIFVNTNRMPLLKIDYRIESESFNVINPMGGGIYVLVPLGTDLGWLDIRVDGAVRSPYYSMRTGHLTTNQEWNTIIKKYPGPLADFESDNYMFTVPSSQIQDFNNPNELLEKWNEAMDVYQLLHGRPLERARSEAFMLDTRTSVEGSYPGGYPVTPGWDGEDIKQAEFSPFVLINNTWKNIHRDDALALFHEMAHHHFGYAMTDARIPGHESEWTDEIETFVNVPFAAIINSVLKEPMDTAMKYSTYQKFSRLDAAIDWMVTANFRNGDPIGWDPTTDYQPAELPYQARGSAKYLDLAAIFGGWDALGAIYKTFYDEDVAKGVPVTYTGQPLVSRDHFLENGSNALGCNIASLFHFWGVQPSDTLAAKLSPLPQCQGAEDRIEYYLSNAPRTNEDLRAFHTEKLKVEPYQLKPQVYELLLPSFDTTEAQQIRTQGARILKEYFGVEPDDAPSTPVLLNDTFSVAGEPSDSVTFSWTPSVDPEGEKLLYSWRLFDAKTHETLVSRSWVDGTQTSINNSELTTALAPYADSTGGMSLSQEVTTSDLFTIVTSRPLLTSARNISGIIGNDGKNATLPAEFGLNLNYPVPFNPLITIHYSVPRKSFVSITVYGMLGRKVTRLVSEEKSPGNYSVRFDGSRLGSGTYFYKMQADNYSETKKAIYLK